MISDEFLKASKGFLMLAQPDDLISPDAPVGEASYLFKGSDIVGINDVPGAFHQVQHKGVYEGADSAAGLKPEVLIHQLIKGFLSQKAFINAFLY